MRKTELNAQIKITVEPVVYEVPLIKTQVEDINSFSITCSHRDISFSNFGLGKKL